MEPARERGYQGRDSGTLVAALLTFRAENAGCPGLLTGAPAALRP
jgi:hypothetical protein